MPGVRGLFFSMKMYRQNLQMVRLTSILEAPTETVHGPDDLLGPQMEHTRLFRNSSKLSLFQSVLLSVSSRREKERYFADMPSAIGNYGCLSAVMANTWEEASSPQIGPNNSSSSRSRNNNDWRQQQHQPCC